MFAKYKDEKIHIYKNILKNQNIKVSDMFTW